MNTPLPTLDQMTDILDIKGVLGVDLLWVWVLGFSLLASILGFTVFHLWKNRKERRPSAPPRTPLEIALGKLDELVISRLVEGGQVRRFYFQLSDLFREFVEHELRLKAQEATLEELRPMFRDSLDLNNEEKREANWLLEMADLAKFARYVPPKEDIVQSVKVCRVWMTRLAERRHAALETPIEKATA